MVISFLSDQRQHIVGRGKTVHAKETGGRVQRNRQSVFLLPVQRHERRRLGLQKGRRRIRAPVHRIDGESAAGRPHIARSILHRIVADGNARIIGPPGGNDTPAFRRYGRPDDIGGHHALVCLPVHLLQQIQQEHRPLAETGQDERPPAVFMFQIPRKRLPDIFQRDFQALGPKRFAHERLERALAVIGRIEVQVPAQQGIHALHFAQQGLPPVLRPGVGIVADGTFGGVIVTDLGGNDVENIGLTAPGTDIPLRNIGIVRSLRNALLLLRKRLFAGRSAGDKQDGQQPPASHTGCHGRQASCPI